MAKTMVFYSLPVTSYGLKEPKYHFVKCWIIVTVLSLVISQNIAPQNTAVNVETPVTYLNCSNSGASSNQFVWSFTNYSSGATSNVATGCSPFNTQLYEVDTSSPNACNLIILNAQPTQSGLYTCSPGGQTASSAQFIVLGGDVICSTNPSVYASENQSVQLSCGTLVYGNMEPVMFWTNSEGVIVPSNLSNNNMNYIGATFSVQAQLPTVPSYTCSAKFSVPTAPPTGTATNPPTYTSSCNTQPLQVVLEYPPSSATITLNGNPDNISCTDTLTCSAVSNPNSTYTWTLPDGSTRTGPILTTSQTSETGQSGSNLVYICTASNSQGSVQANITLNITYCGSPSHNVGAIVGGVIGGFVGVTLIILLICCCVNSCPLYKCCREEKLKAEQSSSSSSSLSSGTYEVPHEVTDPPPVYEAVTEYDYVGNDVEIWTCASSRTIYLRPPLPHRHLSLTDLSSQDHNLSANL